MVTPCDRQVASSLGTVTVVYQISRKERFLKKMDMGIWSVGSIRSEYDEGVCHEEKQIHSEKHHKQSQYYFFFSMGTTKCILLAVMAYDQYLAICNPLRYSLLMRIPVCLHFSAGFWTGGFITHLVPTILISHLNFCDPQKINHFFCDSDPIYKLSCSDTFLVEALGYKCCSVVILSSFLLTMSSYEHIVVTIIRLSSLEARKKAFSTCAFHLTVITIYYGTIIFANIRPPAKYNFTIGKVVSIFYCVVTLLNISSRMKNISVVTEFLLLGFSGPSRLQFLQSGIFVVIYLMALVGNGLIVTIASLDPCLHTPMYFFLKNLSLSDVCLMSSTVPKTVANSLTHINSISFSGCVMQVFLVPFATVAELFLLTVMSIDRYAAVCHPLHYELIMNRGLCVHMVTLSWLSSGLISVIHTAGTFSLTYCGPNEIQQFFCDIPQLLAITCSDCNCRNRAHSY
ncbi:Olfactory Receptor 14A16 [Manis pentadactyla]|nr:Olfactory Receptor 14A16 [Manis pentadactyla]